MGIRLNSSNHTHQAVLSQGRRDPFTQKQLVSGDNVVFCERCACVYLESSWVAGGSKCIDTNCQSRTSTTRFPENTTIRFGPRGSRTRPRPSTNPCTEPLAAWSLGISCVGFFLSMVILGLVGIILGHMALNRINKSDGELKGKGLAIAGLVIGYLMLLVMLINAAD